MNLTMAILDPRSLRPNSFNVNIVSPENEMKLDASIARNGMFKPIVVRTLADGALEIIGGEHRAAAAVRLNLPEVPVFNLGVITDQQAKEISLLDNSRNGADDTLGLAELLTELGGVEETAQFMPFSEADYASIFSSVNIDLDGLDIPDSDALPQASETPVKPAQTHAIMRFAVPVEDQGKLQKKIEETMRIQKFTQEDSLKNAGNALVYLLMGK